VTSAAAVFLFATEDGTIVGWNPTVQPSGAPSGTSYGIITLVDNSKAGAVYKGLAIFADPNSNAAFLYAANFSGMVEMYDRIFIR
jgi:hypothetical protein